MSAVLSSRGAPEENNQHQKGQEKNKDPRRRHHDPRQYEYPKELDAVDELLDIIHKQESKIKMLEETKEVVERRSFEITKQMARVSGNFENVNDRLANTNLTERFNNLYDNDWIKLSRWLGQTFSVIRERIIIHSLTTLMKNGYEECLRLADEQIREFLLLDKSQHIPTNENHEELYAVRKQYAQTDTARTNIKRRVLDKILDAEEHTFLNGEEKHQETNQQLQNFLTKYLDCCWLMVVSNPPIALNFDVIGKTHCTDHFTRYSLKKPVEDETKVENTVYEVVWPSVCLQDGTADYKKGDVIVVSKGMLIAKGHSNASCSCFSKEQGEPNSRAIGENDRPYSSPGSSKENSSGTVQQKKGLLEDTFENNIIPIPDEDVAENKGQQIKPTGISRRPRRTADKMAMVVEVKDQSESKLSSLTVIERFHSLYVNEWSNLKSWMIATFPSMPEHQIIRHLTTIMKTGYQECMAVADAQIRNFLMLHETAVSPTYKEDKELFILRKKRAHKDNVKVAVEREILEKILRTENVSLFCLLENGNTTREKLQEFLNGYLDCCWLMVTSTPPVKLNFDAVGQVYSKCEEQFHLFSQVQPVADKTKGRGTVCEVVWPSVCLQDASTLYTKGHVIVISEGKY